MSTQPVDKKYHLLFLIAGTLVMIAVMVITGAVLKTPATPNGILDLEFAYTAEKAFTVINAWDGKSGAFNMHAAKINTWLDFIFLYFYSLLLYNACRLIAGSFTGFIYIWGRLLAKGALAAGVLDVLENTGMLITLHGNISDGTTLFTFIFSISKWTMALAALGYVLIAGSILLYKKLKNQAVRRPS